MKKFLVLTIVFLISLMVSGLATAGLGDNFEDPIQQHPDTYSCNNGRLQINALQTQLQEAVVCLGDEGAGMKFICTGGSRMISTFFPQDPNCEDSAPPSGFSKVATVSSKITLTALNIEYELSNLFSINSTTCNGSLCVVSLNGFNITSEIITAFEGFLEMTEDTDGDGLSLLTFRMNSSSGGNSGGGSWSTK